MIKRNDKSGAKKFRKELKRKKVAKAMARAGKGVGGAKDWANQLVQFNAKARIKLFGPS